MHILELFIEPEETGAIIAPGSAETLAENSEIGMRTTLQMVPQVTIGTSKQKAATVRKRREIVKRKEREIGGTVGLPRGLECLNGGLNLKNSNDGDRGDGSCRG